MDKTDWPTTLSIEGETYTLLAQRRQGGAIYRAIDTDRILRIGTPAGMETEISLSWTLAEQWFPIAKPFATGISDGFAYILEEFLGEQHFGAIFARGFAEEGMIPTASLEEYGSVIRSLLRSQASHTSGPLDPDAFRRSTHIPILRNERPDWITVLERAFERHWATVSRYPSVLTHYDCNPYNAYPKGMIDFETSGAGPWGYDAVSAICAIGWFPEAGDFERTGAYVYTDEQIAAYYHMLDTYALEKNLPPISEAREAFEFFRGVWACARMGDVPKLQAWRYARFERIFLERI